MEEGRQLAAVIKLSTHSDLHLSVPETNLPQDMKFTATVSFQQDYVKMMYQRALEHHTPDKNDTFCDAIISARNEAAAEDHWMLPDLREQNILNAVFDLFSAGSETTKMSLRWLFVFHVQTHGHAGKDEERS